jgi:hypothetical protein
MADLISDEPFDQFAVSGSFATIGERIRERHRGRYDPALPVLPALARRSALAPPSFRGA